MANNPGSDDSNPNGASNDRINDHETLSEVNVTEDIALENINTAPPSDTLVHEAKPVDTTHLEETQAPKASSNTFYHPTPQDNPQDGFAMIPNIMRGQKRNISFLYHSLVAKLRKFRENKKMFLRNWKNEGQKKPITGHEEATDLQNTTTEATESSGSSNGSSRKDWEAIRAISNDRFRLRLYYCLNKSDKNSVPWSLCQVGARNEGSFHLAVVLCVARHGNIETWIIKVPAHGTARFWTKEDAYMMRREVEIIRQIGYNTDMPVPEIEDFDTGLDDRFLRAPWILMKQLPGKHASNIWFDQPYNSATAYLKADVPTPATHRRRVNFLNSLANQMVKLQRLKFDRIGMAKINHTYDVSHNSSDILEEFSSIVGPSYHWSDPSDANLFDERGPFSTTQDYIQLGLQTTFGSVESHENHPNPNDDDLVNLGVRKMMEMVFNTTAFNSGGTDETFVIHHDDLDLQNILTDEDGNVTGIIDWDGAFVGPRCVGPAAAPLFLTRDWFPNEHGERLEKSPHFGWNTPYYRNIYAAAMHKAELKEGISSDAQFTAKSALYQAAFGAIYEGGDYLDFGGKIITGLPDNRIDAYDFSVLLGRGFPAAEEMLKREIAKMCEPTLPGEEHMRELDAVCGLNINTDKVDEKDDTLGALTSKNDMGVGGSELHSDFSPQTVTALKRPSHTPEEHKGQQMMLSPPTHEVIYGSNDETHSTGIAGSGSKNNEDPHSSGSSCFSLASKNEERTQAAPQLQTQPQAKQDMLEMKVSTKLLVQGLGCLVRVRAWP